MRRGANRLCGAGPHRLSARAAGQRCTFTLLACLLGLLAWPTSVLAQQVQPISSHTYTFGESAAFILTFPTEPRPAEARLHLRASGQPVNSFVAPLDASSITVVRDLLAAPLPPFTTITYWWEYAALDGTLVKLQEQTFTYVDTRFTWQTATERNISAHWIAGERPQMMQSLDVALDALTEIHWALETSQSSSVNIYIYPSHTDLLSAMQVSGLEWAGASAYPELGVILVAVPPTRDGFLTMDRDIPHELAHKVLYDSLGAQGYASLPTWLVEGLAVHFEARPNPDYALALTNAQQTGTLIPLSELCAPFPDDANRALLAYAESASFVNYLRQTYGWSGVRTLLTTYADGMACGTGIQQALNADLSQMDWAWRVWLESKGTSTAESPISASTTVLLRDAGPWLLLFGVLLLPGLILVVVDRR